MHVFNELEGNVEMSDISTKKKDRNSLVKSKIERERI